MGKLKRLRENVEKVRLHEEKFDFAGRDAQSEAHWLSFVKIQ